MDGQLGSRAEACQLRIYIDEKGHILKLIVENWHLFKNQPLRTRFQLLLYTFLKAKDMKQGFFFVRVWMCGHVWWCTSMCVYMNVGDNFGCHSSVLAYLYFWDMDLTVLAISSQSASQWSSGLCLSSSPVLCLEACTTKPWFSTCVPGVEIRSLCLQGKSTSPMESSLLPPAVFFNFWLSASICCLIISHNHHCRDNHSILLGQVKVDEHSF